MEMRFVTYYEGAPSGTLADPKVKKQFRRKVRPAEGRLAVER